MLKCGSPRNSFFSATRRSASSTFGCMKPEKSDSGVSLSIGGSVGLRRLDRLVGWLSSLVLQPRPAPQEVFLFSLPSTPSSHPVLRMQERARLDALLAARPVVVLHVFAHPGEDLRRHRHAVDRVAAVQPARRLVGAHRDLDRQRALAVHPPEDEHARLGRGHVQVVALELVLVQHELEAGVQPLRDAVGLAQQPGRAARVGEHAVRLPDRVGPAALRLARRCITTAMSKDGFSTPELYALCYDFPRENP